MYDDEPSRGRECELWKIRDENKFVTGNGDIYMKSKELRKNQVKN